ncbi:Pre-mRNA-splicing factor SPF27 [Fimicolochytrium jonesii]|uniref:Pre-mRNA-splicing factor SPF27 n=1 Tax=Fimicolochytrium jonesii TaxID=1396493 RepID=UPI0022FE9F76|nr:Pre-mRNA-splicing factor SPF27 [Fimicolochytrium jonesii]KAI8818145.1 Pre-mRNA-splicing factor SPF27 [Fimicolochytrium jonesii]
MSSTNEDLDVHLDSLPYIDGAVPPDLAEVVDNLIAEELARGPKPTDILLPPEITLFESNPLLAADLERVANTSKPTTLINTTRFRLEPPPQKSSLETWEKAVENAQAQLEHQSNRLINLELVNSFGSNAWKVHCHQLEWLNKSLAKEVEEIKKEVVDINKDRKVEQLKVGQTLQQLSYRYSMMLHQTLQVDAATNALEREVEALRAQKEQLSQA